MSLIGENKTSWRSNGIIWNLNESNENCSGVGAFTNLLWILKNYDGENWKNVFKIG